MGRLIAEFVVTVPDIQSAMSVSGDGSARIKLDIPESDLAEVLKFMAFGRRKALTARIFDEGVDVAETMTEWRPNG